MMQNYVMGLVICVLSCPIYARSVCDRQVTKEIEACAKSNFMETDLQLNRVYQSIQSRWGSADQADLQQAQRYWIQYKTKYCQNAYDIVSPGKEAAIDKWACLESVTTTRIHELLYLDNAYSMTDFAKALNFIAREYEHGNPGRVLEKLANEESDTKNDLDWKRYMNANCRMTHVKLLEENNVCVGRMSFYRNW